MKKIICLLLCVVLLSSCGIADRAENDALTTTVSSAEQPVTKATTSTFEKAESDDSEELEICDEYYDSINSQSLILPEDVEIVEADADEWFHSFMKYGFTVSDISGNYAYGTYSDYEEEKRYEAVYDITNGEFTELTELEEYIYYMTPEDIEIMAAELL